MRHRLAGHAHNPAVLVRDTDKDQATVQVGHRCCARGDRRSAAALLEVDGQLLGTRHGHQVPDQFESDIGGGTVQQELPFGHPQSISTAMPTACSEHFQERCRPPRGADACPLRRKPVLLRFSWSGPMVNMNGRNDTIQDAGTNSIWLAAGMASHPGHMMRTFRRSGRSSVSYGVLLRPSGGRPQGSARIRRSPGTWRRSCKRLFTQQLQPVLDAFRVQFADSIGQTLALQLELIIAPQLEVFRELARSVMPRLIELQPLNLLHQTCFRPTGRTSRTSTSRQS